MFKLQIIDDGFFVDSSLKDKINWSACGFEISGVSKSISEAKDVLDNFDALMLFADCNFDFSILNGFLGKKIIVASSNDDYQTAFNCLEHNVSGFIQCPVSAGKLFPVLNKIENELKNDLLFRYVSLFSVANGLSPGVFLKTGVNANNIGGNLYYVMAVPDIINDGVAIDAINDGIYQIIKRYSQDNSCIYTVFSEENGTGLIVGEEAMIKNGIRIEQFLLNIVNLFSKEKFSVSVLAGKKASSLFDIDLSKKSIKHLNEIRFYRGTGLALSFDLESKTEFTDVFDKNIISETADAIINGNESDINTALSDFFKTVNESLISVSALKTALYDIVIRIKNNISSLSIDINSFFPDTEWIDSIEKTSISYVREKLEVFFTDMSTQLKSHIKNDGESVVKSIIDYISKNYYADVDLKYFAKKYFINVSYLGQLFKKMTGTSFNKFLSNIRISEAKKLLASKKIKIFEVAARVGFKDSNYFCTKFEKEVGMTPTNYRNKNSKNE